MKTKFQTLYDDGYKLVITEPKLSVTSKNFEPDILFFGEERIGTTIKSDVQYLEVKYLEDVPFNPGGQRTVYNTVQNNGSANVTKANPDKIIRDVLNNP
ncbi:MAG: hypothetical protein K8R44_08545 [Sulfurimonas sp.]|nr:hypothetical protein [Sulfurimonas sp.]